MLPLGLTDYDAALRIVEAEAEAAPAENESIKAYLLQLIASDRLEILGERIGTITDPTERNRVIGAVASAWRARDPERLAAYANYALEGEVRNQVLASALQSIIHHKRYDSAQRIIETFPFSNARVGAIQTLVANWAANDPEGALKWLHGLGVADERIAGMKSLISAIQEKHSPEWLAEKANSAPSPEEQKPPAAGMPIIHFPPI